MFADHNGRGGAAERPNLPCPSLKLRQGPGEIWEIVSIQHLDSSGVIAIERSGTAGTPGVRAINRGVEPQSEMISMDRLRDGIARRGLLVQNAVRSRCWNGSRGHDERLDIEPAKEFPLTSSVGVGLDITLVPRHTKRPARLLNDKEIEFCLRR